MNKQTVYDIQPKGKKVYIRVDYNVPHDKEGHILDDRRIRATIPTLRYFLDGGASLVIASHMGRPKGEVKPELSLAPVAQRLSEILQQPVEFASDCIGEEAAEKKQALQPGQVLLLENLRFHKEEEKNDPAFAKELVAGCDAAVNDAFGVSHRTHASVAGVGKLMPMVAGLLLKKEIDFLDGVIEKPERPFAAIIGGAKISDKIQVIANLMEKADVILIGGGMANTFLAAQGYGIGKSLVEADKIDLAKSLIAQAKEQGTKLLLPEDVTVAAAFANDAEHKVVPVDQVPADWMILDVGTKTQELFAKELAPMKLIVWNGPMGVFEMENYAKGTEAVAKAVADSDAVSIVGGGDSVSAVNKTGLADKISHISTGGGASLEYLEGKQLPGVVSLSDK